VPFGQQEEAIAMNQPVPDELISAYFDGEVTPEERKQVECQLESSNDLRQLLDDTAKLSALLHSFPRESAPAELAQSVQSQIQVKKIAAVSPTAPKKTSLRREWMAFGTGILVTAASLLVYVTLDHAAKPVSERQLGLAVAPSKDWGRSETALGRQFGLSENTIPLHDLSTEGMSSATGKGLSPTPSAAMDGDSKGFADLSHLPESYSLKSEVASTETPDVQEFLWSLKNGDLIVRQVFDPSSAIAIGEFTVVDIDRGAEEIKLLLQKRDVQKADDKNSDESTLTASLKEGSLKESEEASVDKQVQDQKGLDGTTNTHDDLYVFYIRTKGDRLADTISDSLKDHPDIYKKFETHLPIGLPIAVAQNAYGDESRDRLGEVDENTPAAPPSVTLEGNLAVKSYVDSNGLTSSQLSTADNSPKLVAESKNAPEGYTTFRVGMSNQRPVALQQKAATQQNLAGVNNSTVAGNTVTWNGLNYFQGHLGNQSAGLRFKNSRAATDNRDPRLVRMLIILKHEASHASVTP
jgi:hypothetical protein